MLTTLLYSTVLAASPQPAEPLPDFATQLDRAELIGDGDELQLVGCDSAGEVVGAIAIWIDDRERMHLASDYGDGYAETVVEGDRADTQSTLPADEIGRRADLMLDRLATPGVGPQEGWFMCAAKTGVAVGACSASGLVLAFGCP
ncbi:MAG TPA: hypothetical protein VK034_20570, partial [Enhygromyxa sp.]|nr:hypothetical protein [Enhygromyxa sp.]